MPGVLSIIMPFAGRRELTAALAALTALDRAQMRWRKLPPLYASGVRYQRETCLAPHVRETCERWLTAEQLLDEGQGDCEDLACYRAAELQVSGEDQRAEAWPVKTPKGWHIVVKRSDGSVEDPSLRLGMKVRRRRVA